VILYFEQLYKWFLVVKKKEEREREREREREEERKEMRGREKEREVGHNFKKFNAQN